MIVGTHRVQGNTKARLLILLCSVLLFGNVAPARASNDAPVEGSVEYTTSCRFYEGQQSCYSVLLISGMLGPRVQSQVEAFLSSLRDHQPKVETFNVHLDSMGGPVAVALQLGRALRAAEAMTSVEEHGRCVSACVLLFAAGANREPVGSGAIGIHRPFFEALSGAVTPEVVHRGTEAVRQTIRAYLRDMNVSEQLADDMMVVPSDQIRWLTPQEMERFGMLGWDPVIEETRQLQLAQRLGITRSELMKRQAQEFGDCYDARFVKTPEDIDRCIKLRHPVDDWIVPSPAPSPAPAPPALAQPQRN